jgi:predicted permease
MLLSFFVTPLQSAHTAQIVERVLWTLTFAAQLVLLVVLLGRDRARRYPWFTAGIALAALRLMAEVLLTGRMATIPLQATLLTLADIGAVVGLLVLVELARRAFAGLQRSLWIVNTVGMLVVAGGVLAAWGPWPTWKQLTANPSVSALNLMVMVAGPKETPTIVRGIDKGDLLVALLTVGLGLLVVLFGRRFKAGWRSHTQMIAIGLSTAAIAWLAMQGIVQSIARTAHPQNRVDYDRVVGLINNLVNANKLVYLCALLWWIVWLWLDEPGAATMAPEPTAPAPEEESQPAGE